MMLSSMYSFAVSCLLGLGFVSLVTSQSPPTTGLDIALRTGTFRGARTDNVTDKWLGIPYAQAPEGALRFKAPRPISKRSNVLRDASKFGNVCPQPASGNLGAPIAEDCLFLNVWRPQGANSRSKLPVLVWIHGGSFATGASSSPNFDPTRIIQHSVQIGKPIAFASVNYRLNTFGFLAGADVPPEDLNAGLLDQRLAFEFLRDNIAAFGGDPAKITIWGQSAGAGSVQTHVLFPPSQPSFRAVIANSATGPIKNAPPPSTYSLPGKPFTRLLAATGCSSGRGAVACLQKVPTDALFNISNSMVRSTLNDQLWEPTVHPQSFLNQRPSQRVLSGRFLHVPYLSGTNVNEGATFAGSVRNLNLTGAAQNSAFDNLIGHLVIDNGSLTGDVFDGIHALFRENDPTLGAPFNTGDSLFDRAEAWYTAQNYIGPRRLFFEAGSSRQPMFAYYFREFIPGNDPSLGVFHASELPLLFGPIPTPVETDFANQMLTFYINFIHDLNPGASWPRYSVDERRVMQLLRGNVTLIPDDWDTDKSDFVSLPRVLAEFQK
ncbi:lipase [Pleurotus eryngii]|uniref:Carboxylic ester hydrolase n=1 Tax=Pleurotus eryngii TaxID=5323 RepID=A0A9P5ZYB9_PLEER|nr:lipase [Pleurotus eryngii]